MFPLDPLWNEILVSRETETRVHSTDNWCVNARRKRLCACDCLVSEESKFSFFRKNPKTHSSTGNKRSKSAPFLLDVIAKQWVHNYTHTCCFHMWVWTCVDHCKCLFSPTGFIETFCLQSRLFCPSLWIHPPWSGLMRFTYDPLMSRWICNFWNCHHWDQLVKIIVSLIYLYYHQILILGCCRYEALPPSFSTKKARSRWHNSMVVQPRSREITFITNPDCPSDSESTSFEHRISVTVYKISCLPLLSQPDGWGVMFSVFSQNTHRGTHTHTQRHTHTHTHTPFSTHKIVPRPGGLELGADLLVRILPKHASLGESFCWACVGLPKHWLMQTTHDKVQKEQSSLSSATVSFPLFSCSPSRDYSKSCNTISLGHNVFEIGAIDSEMSWTIRFEF